MSYKFNFALFLLCFSWHISAQENVIYGPDNRQEINSYSGQEIRSFQAAVALRIDTQNILSLGNGQIRLKLKSLSETYRDGNRPLCEDVRFKEQPALGSCTGFLVAENLLVTAGHCAAMIEDCQDRAWIFGVNLERSGQNLFLEKEIYFCKEIISQRYLKSRSDFAIIELDRKVEAIKPLTFSRVANGESPLNIGDSLFMIGHPLGLPMKIVDEGKVIDTGIDGVTTSLDAFSGNSGSPVFLQNTKVVHGLLVRGEPDFNLNPSRGCFEEVRCLDSNCTGESMTTIDTLKLDEISRLLSQRPMLKTFDQYCQEKHPTTEILRNYFSENDCGELYSNLLMMKRLSLNGLNIEDVAPLASLTLLESISLKNNKISDIYSLRWLNKLKKLNLEGNPIGKNDVQCPSGPHIPFELRFFCAKYVDGE